MRTFTTALLALAATFAAACGTSTEPKTAESVKNPYPEGEVFRLEVKRDLDIGAERHFVRSEAGSLRLMKGDTNEGGPFSQGYFVVKPESGSDPVMYVAKVAEGEAWHVLMEFEGSSALGWSTELVEVGNKFWMGFDNEIHYEAMLEDRNWYDCTRACAEGQRKLLYGTFEGPSK